MMVDVGSVYRHYKGKDYKVLCLARHSETLEEYVVYEALYGDHEIWVRPLKMFSEMVDVNGLCQKRFEKKVTE